jgi:hypothetical protein
MSIMAALGPASSQRLNSGLRAYGDAAAFDAVKRVEVACVFCVATVPILLHFDWSILLT